ncbi:MAG TPA: allophanate hydrolase subunit 1 [Methylocella sp.]|nr:allophanate hydrolase subunit 1 [Methylocella sp.]
MSAKPGAPLRPRYLPAGESALTVEFGKGIDPGVHDRVLALDAAVAAAQLEGVIETVPTYRSLMIHFDPRRLTPEALIQALDRLDREQAPQASGRRLWHIPVCYEGPHGEDIAEVAALLGIEAAEAVSLHAGASYRVYMYGFAPGWTFLGGLPERLAIPRRLAPRAPAQPGALLIAGGQALIAGCAMPTGWYAVGRTPVKMFDPKRERAFFAAAGDGICFERIGADTFEALSHAASAGEIIAWDSALERP